MSAPNELPQNKDGYDSFSIMSSIAASAMSYHVTNYSLESYYSLVHFLYTGIIDLQVNLNDFAIGSPPTKPYSLACKERLAFEGLFTSTPSPGLDASTDADTTKVRPLVPVVTLTNSSNLRIATKSKILELTAELGSSNRYPLPTRSRFCLDSPTATRI